MYQSNKLLIQLALIVIAITINASCIRNDTRNNTYSTYIMGDSITLRYNIFNHDAIEDKVYVSFNDGFYMNHIVILDSSGDTLFKDILSTDPKISLSRELLLSRLSTYYFIFEKKIYMLSVPELCNYIYINKYSKDMGFDIELRSAILIRM